MEMEPTRPTWSLSIGQKSWMKSRKEKKLVLLHRIFFGRSEIFIFGRSKEEMFGWSKEKQMFGWSKDFFWLVQRFFFCWSKKEMLRRGEIAVTAVYSRHPLPHTFVNISKHLSIWEKSEKSNQIFWFATKAGNFDLSNCIQAIIIHTTNVFSPNNTVIGCIYVLRWGKYSQILLPTKLPNMYLGVARSGQKCQIGIVNNMMAVPCTLMLFKARWSRKSGALQRAAALMHIVMHLMCSWCSWCAPNWSMQPSSAPLALSDKVVKLGS